MFNYKFCPGKICIIIILFKEKKLFISNENFPKSSFLQAMCK